MKDIEPSDRLTKTIFCYSSVILIELKLRNLKIISSIDLSQDFRTNDLSALSSLNSLGVHFKNYNLLIAVEKILCASTSLYTFI